MNREGLEAISFSEYNPILKQDKEIYFNVINSSEELPLKDKLLAIKFINKTAI